MVPDMYVIIVVITNQLVVSCDMLYYTIPVTDGDTTPSYLQTSSTTPQGAVKTSSAVGKCIAQHSSVPYSETLHAENS